MPPPAAAPPRARHRVAAFSQTPAGEAPREVKIQRKKRLYESKDVHDLLSRSGLPKRRYLGRALQLEDFDDLSYETRDPEGWVAPHSGMPAAPARVVELSPEGRMEVTPCAVLGYDPRAALYTVEMARSGEIRSVPRVSLCFGAEDPEVYVARLAAAHSERAATEDALLANLCVDCMPLDDAPGPGEDVLARVLDQALSTRRLREKTEEETQRRLLREVEQDFKTAMNRLVMEAAAAQAGGLRTLARGGFVDLSMLVPLPVALPARHVRPAPLRGCGEGPRAASLRPRCAVPLGRVPAWALARCEPRRPLSRSARAALRLRRPLQRLLLQLAPDDGRGHQGSVGDPPGEQFDGQAGHVQYGSAQQGRAPGRAAAGAGPRVRQDVHAAQGHLVHQDQEHHQVTRPATARLPATQARPRLSLGRWAHSCKLPPPQEQLHGHRQGLVPF